MRIQVIALTPDGYMPNAEVRVIFTIFVAALFRTVRRITDHETDDVPDLCHTVDPRNRVEAGRKKAEKYRVHSVHGRERASRRSLGGAHHFVTKTVTNSDGEPRGTEGNCHQFCDQIEGN
jgi:hypothetical protein